MPANAEKIQHETTARGPGEQPRSSKPVRRVRWIGSGLLRVGVPIRNPGLPIAVACPIGSRSWGWAVRVNLTAVRLHVVKVPA